MSVIALPRPSPPPVNQTALADALHVSRQTLGLWVRRWPNFPVVQRGKNGRPWLFDLATVSEYLAARRAEQANIQVARDEALAQLIFPFEEPDRADSGGLSLDAQLKAAKLAKMQREEAERRRELVPAAAVAEVLEDQFYALGRAMDSAIRQVGRKHGIPEPVLREIEASFHEARRDFVRSVDPTLGGHLADRLGEVVPFSPAVRSVHTIENMGRAEV